MTEEIYQNILRGSSPSVFEKFEAMSLGDIEMANDRDVLDSNNNNNNSTPDPSAQGRRTSSRGKRKANENLAEETIMAEDEKTVKKTKP
ncbi:hypothetical protein BC938DRAFT_477381, partial [Jimgerdemannia flammicorona]